MKGITLTGLLWSNTSMILPRIKDSISNLLKHKISKMVAISQYQVITEYSALLLILSLVVVDLALVAVERENSEIIVSLTFEDTQQKK